MYSITILNINIIIIDSWLDCTITCLGSQIPATGFTKSLSTTSLKMYGQNTGANVRLSNLRLQAVLMESVLV